MRQFSERRPGQRSRGVLGTMAAAISAAIVGGTGTAHGQCDQWIAGPALNTGAETAIVWDPDGNGPVAPRLVVGGSFTMAGALPVGRVAVWDGTSWSTLGTGMDGPVIALTVFNNELYAGGNFINASGSFARNIAKWNGASWVPVGGSINNNAVTSLGVHNGELYIGGTFLGSPGNRVARLSGGTWQPLGIGTDNVVYHLAERNGSLIVGGDFGTAGLTAAQRIAWWNGPSATWSLFSPPLVAASGLNSVRTSLPFNGDLIVGGTWFDATGTISPCIARYTGSAWMRMGNGLTNQASALAVYNNELYVGGGFLQSSSTVLNRVGRWDGTNWQSVGGGVNGSVRGLAAFNGELIAVGSFTQAGTGGGAVAVGNWARWRGSTPPTITQQPGSINVEFPTTTIQWSVGATTPFPPLTYQWRRNGVPLVNGPGGAAPGGGTVQNAQSNPLIIHNSVAADAGTYDCVIGSGCGSVTSATGTLTYAPRTVINFVALPGADGLPGTSDDAPYTGADYSNTGGTRVMDEEYQTVGVHFSGSAGTLTLGLIGGGLNPDGALGSPGNNAVLRGAGSGGVTPVRMRFDRQQVGVEMYVAAALGASGTSVPVTVKRAGGTVGVTSLTNANSLQYTGTAGQLAGRWMITSPDGGTFDELTLGLTAPSNGGVFVDNLSFQARQPSDINNSGGETIQDLFDFLALYFANDPRADFNQSGTITIQDLFDFLASYFAP
ncbi:MAG: hypothetical protein IT438_17145 [Phycisphaerales bacterium]|nr:hypothetical protein [Phycisphaerales bacterium]